MGTQPADAQAPIGGAPEPQEHPNGWFPFLRGAIPIAHAILAILAWFKYAWPGMPGATKVARCTNAQTSATMPLDWTIILLVISALGTNIHRLMQCTCPPTTIGNQGRDLQGIPLVSGAAVPAQPETVEAESPTMAWKMANLANDQVESPKNYIPIDGLNAQDKFTRWLSALSPGWQSGFTLTKAISMV